jgi:hypothetical protein
MDDGQIVVDSIERIRLKDITHDLALESGFDSVKDLLAITATTIAGFQRTRHEAGISNRTINMDVGVLSRVLNFQIKRAARGLLLARCCSNAVVRMPLPGY